METPKNDLELKNIKHHRMIGLIYICIFCLTFLFLTLLVIPMLSVEAGFQVCNADYLHGKLNRTCIQIEAKIPYGLICESCLS